MDTNPDPEATGHRDGEDSGLPDLSRIPLDELVHSAALVRALREVTLRAAEPGTILAAFENFLLHEPSQR